MASALTHNPFLYFPPGSQAPEGLLPADLSSGTGQSAAGNIALQPVNGHFLFFFTSTVTGRGLLHSRPAYRL